MNMTKYQDQILKDLKNGAKLQCTEGSDYKAWLVYPDGTERKVRRDSAEKVCNENESLLIFGRPDGIAHRKAVQTGSSVAAGVRVSEERKMKNILIELGDEELKLVSQKELDEIIKSDEEFDGFHGWTLKGRLATNDNTAELYNELIMQVGNKYEGESRHETALRYIKGAEMSDNKAHSDKQC
jgi:hypothetical protein